MPDDSLIPAIPADIAGARIGSGYNQFTRKIIEGAWAILPDSAGENDVIFIKGTAKLAVTANSSSAAAATDSFFSLDTKASGGYDGVAAGVNASVDFHMQNAQASHHQEENLNVYCSYAFCGQRQELRLMDAAELIKIMTPTFVDKYNAVIKAKTVEAYMKAYVDLIGTFGHACVTTVFLTAASAFRLTLERTDDASSNRQKYGGSASLSGHYGGGYAGASVAADWAKDQQTADATTKLNIAFDSVPEDAPTADWVNTMLTNFSNIALNALTEKATLITPPSENTQPRAPELPHGVPDKSRSVGKPQINPDDPGIGDGLQNEIMKQDGFTGTWDDYVTAQKNLYDSINPASVVQGAIDTPEPGRESQ